MLALVQTYLASPQYDSTITPGVPLVMSWTASDGGKAVCSALRKGDGPHV